MEGEQLRFFVDVIDSDAATAESEKVCAGVIQTQFNQIAIQTQDAAGELVAQVPVPEAPCELVHSLFRTLGEGLDGLGHPPPSESATQQEQHTGSDGKHGHNRRGPDEVEMDKYRYARDDKPNGQQEQAQVFWSQSISSIHSFCLTGFLA